MKRLTTIAFLAVLYACVNAVSAQKISQDKIVSPNQFRVEKPRMFNKLPDKFIVKKIMLDELFTTRQRYVSISLSDNEVFEGTILEKVQKNPNVVSINIRLTNYDSSLLNISRITQSDLSVTYLARVVNIKSGDVLLLRKENDQFYFTKEKQSLTLVE